MNTNTIIAALIIATLIALVVLLRWPAGRQSLRQFVRAIWPVARPILGWACIVLGILGTVLPILQGVIFLAIGVALLGRNNPVIRRVRLSIKWRLRCWSRQDGLRGWLGGHGLAALYKLGAQTRRIMARFKTREQKV